MKSIVVSVREMEGDPERCSRDGMREAAREMCRLIIISNTRATVASREYVTRDNDFLIRAGNQTDFRESPLYVLTRLPQKI